MTLVLEMRGITKRFPGVVANDHVDFRLEKGEIHALLGENGSGKTTLMNILYGLYRPDEGQIFLNGTKVHLTSPKDAIAHGIGMVHQHFMLVPVMTVTENIILGNEVTRGGLFLDLKQAADRIRELSEQYHLEVDPQALIQDLPVGIRQRVEILKALYRQSNGESKSKSSIWADILILDEPTAVLTPEESENLFRTLSSLARQGKSIIFITHKLREVFHVAHRITVLRNGRVVGTTTSKETTETQLASMMVGREVILAVEKKPLEFQREVSDRKPVLHVQDLQVTDDRGSVAVKGVSLDIYPGEILGIAGVQGNGQTELVEALTGLRKTIAGSIHINGVDMTPFIHSGYSGPRKILEQGVAHIPEDRHTYGMVDSYPLTDNLVLNIYYQKPFARGIVRNQAAIEEHAMRLVTEFDIRTPSIFIRAGNLSGGNQQKMVVAREFSRSIILLIAAQPTRGLDVGSIEFIHKQILRKRDQGCAVLLVSVDLDEILSLSDRIAVMYRGHILATVDAKEASREVLGLWMAGIK
ncbi:MAG TPA: ABC transporter ATP-binding protein [Candidatus Limnocylindrales bacterium]|nr:ABC transporter ATP-binding protein [Candidatus Limnocylindrales bacterium]